MEQTSDPQTLQVIQDFAWDHGSVTIHRRVLHGGLLPAVVESWYPNSDDSYGLMLEDDIELSPLFYAWSKMALLHYRYGREEDKLSQLFGISLYQQKSLELRPEGRHRFNPRTTFAAAGLPRLTTPYLSQIPCSWGAIYFPEHWREFHDYLSIRLSETHPRLTQDSVIVPSVRSNKWIRSWKKYFIELAFLRGYVMLYPNYDDYISLSTNHLEVGSHVRDMPTDAYVQKQKLFLLPLMTVPRHTHHSPPTTQLLDMPGKTLPAVDKLPVLDLLGLVTDGQTLLARGTAGLSELFGCEASDQHRDRIGVRDWLCLSSDE